MNGHNQKLSHQVNRGNVLHCLWMDAGVVGYKLCDRAYECERCPLDEALHGHSSEKFFITNRSNESLHTSINVQGCEVGPGLFFHPGHTWARIEEDGIVRVGLDDFGQRMLGTVYSVSFPAGNRELTSGAAACSVTHQSGVTTLLSPLTGKVRTFNSDLLMRPALLNRDPYGEGWTMTVEPTDLKSGLKQLLYGEKVEQWLAAEIEKLRSLITALINNKAADPILTMTDGGILTRDFMQGLTVEQTRRVISSFFPLTSTGEADNQTAILISKRR